MTEDSRLKSLRARVERLVDSRLKSLRARVERLVDSRLKSLRARVERLVDSRLKSLRARVERLVESAATLELQIAAIVLADEAKRKAALQESRAKLKARQLAKAHGIEIEDEQKEFDRLAVWPPEPLRDELDTYDGDHYVYDWTNALERVERYVLDLQKYGN